MLVEACYEEIKHFTCLLILRLDSVRDIFVLITGRFRKIKYGIH